MRISTSNVVETIENNPSMDIGRSEWPHDLIQEVARPLIVAAGSESDFEFDAEDELLGLTHEETFCRTKEGVWSLHCPGGSAPAVIYRLRVVSELQIEAAALGEQDWPHGGSPEAAALIEAAGEDYDAEGEGLGLGDEFGFYRLNDRLVLATNGAGCQEGRVRAWAITGGW